MFRNSCVNLISKMAADPVSCSMSSPKRYFRKHVNGNILRSQAQQIVLNVYSKLRDVYPKWTIENVVKETSEYTGIGVASIFRIKKRHIACDGNIATPSKKRPKANGTRNRTTKYDDFVKTAIRMHVHRFFFRNQPPSVAQVLAEIKEDPDIPAMGQRTLTRLLNDIGFQFAKRQRKSLLLERDDIIVWRQRYLRSIRKYRREGRTIYFTDETWVTAGHTMTKVWADNTVLSSKQAFLSGLSPGLKQPSGRGERIIVTHIGSDSGFVEGALDVFRGKKASDYHEEMDGNRFERWFVALLPKLKPNSVIVLDNASYHSRKLETVPSSSWKKAAIQEWLTEKGIPWDGEMLKPELLHAVSSEKHKYTEYRVDKLAADVGHIVLRLPPYHCELNPIEMVWSQVKSYVARHNETFKLQHVEQLLFDGVQRVSKENWKDYILHTMKIEEKFMELDLLSEDVEPFIITLSPSDTEDTDDDNLSGIENLA